MATGGRAHGPHPRSYDYTLPKKIRKLGLRVALSAKFAQGDLSFVDKVAVQTHKTKYLHEMLRQRGLNRACTGLIVGAEELSEDLKRASLNLPYANVLAAKGMRFDNTLSWALMGVCALDHASSVVVIQTLASVLGGYRDITCCRNQCIRLPQIQEGCAEHGSGRLSRRAAILIPIPSGISCQAHERTELSPDLSTIYITRHSPIKNASYTLI